MDVVDLFLGGRSAALLGVVPGRELVAPVGRDLDMRPVHDESAVVVAAPLAVAVDADHEVETELVFLVQVGPPGKLTTVGRIGQVFDAALKAAASIRPDEISQIASPVDLVSGLLVVDDAAERIAPSANEIQ